MARVAASMLFAVVFFLASVLAGSIVDPVADDGQSFGAAVHASPAIEAKMARPVLAPVKDPVRFLASHRAGGSKFVIDGGGAALLASDHQILAPETDLDRGLPRRTVAPAVRREAAHAVRAPPSEPTHFATLNG